MAQLNLALHCLTQIILFISLLPPFLFVQEPFSNAFFAVEGVYDDIEDIIEILNGINCLDYKHSNVTLQGAKCSRKDEELRKRSRFNSTRHYLHFQETVLRAMFHFLLY